MRKFDNKDLLLRVQKNILEDVNSGDLIEGTGGVRKIRVNKKDSGKSGGYRVFFLDLPQIEVTHLLHILDKKESDNIPTSAKPALKKEATRLKERK